MIVIYFINYLHVQFFLYCSDVSPVSYFNGSQRSIFKKFHDLGMAKVALKPSEGPGWVTFWSCKMLEPLTCCEGFELSCNMRRCFLR